MMYTTNTNHIAATSNSPINSLCPLETALVLTSDNFHSILPLSPPRFPSSCSFPCGSYSKLSRGAMFTVCSQTFIYSLIEKDLCECRYITVKFPCVYLYLSSGNFIIFPVRVSPFCPYFCVILTSDFPVCTQSVCSPGGSGQWPAQSVLLLWLTSA